MTAIASEDVLDAAGLRRAVDSLVGSPVLGVAVVLAAPHPDLPRESASDPRRVRVDLLALAAEGRTFVVHCNCFSPSDLRQLAPVLAGPHAPYVVFPDAQFHLTALAGLGLAVARVGCTRTAATLLAEGVIARHDELEIAALSRRHLGAALPGEWLSGQVLPAWSRLEVVAAAAAAAPALLRVLTPELRAHGLSRAYELECKLLPAVVAMEAAGVGVDGPRWTAIADGWRAELQVTEAPERRAQLEKLISTYAHWPREHLGDDSRMRPHLHPLATDSGRFACSQPNLQQVPSEHTAPGLRSCFRAEPGNVLVIADYAQIELRVAAHLAPCAAMRDVFHAGRDPHRATAATLARKPEAEVTAHERKLAKAVNFGFLFGMGARRFQEYAEANYGLVLDLAAAERAREAFFATFPGIAAWHRKVSALQPRSAREDLTVRTALGRRKRFPAGKFSFNAALNIPVQGTAAEGFKKAMIALHPALAELGGRGILCVHDEYLAEVPEEHGEAARALVQRVMQEAMAEVVTSVPIVVDSRVARHWAE
ncbi:DNA polymerase-1 [Nannocystis exedens]|uniref:DNA-directed DNA polymerase n=1 Tax=Nannocystis exedens TaxID=54 RepID=A0A1I2A951_9BACT|nr:DNA polymerase [Nannocystis exedens]PCC69697.1 DNA polymerase I, thermostable [Nannocystis exedens]SFE40118.1 DNA polymerase-1 [Nannocystis exedens]